MGKAKNKITKETTGGVIRVTKTSHTKTSVKGKKTKIEIKVILKMITLNAFPVNVGDLSLFLIILLITLIPKRIKVIATINW